MIKKFLNVFMCFCLLVQSFLFVEPVMANEKDLKANFNVKFEYTNFSEKKPHIHNSYIFSDGNYQVESIIYELENKYFDDENTITLVIDGQNYQERDYSVNVNIYAPIIYTGEEAEIIYSKKFDVNGNDLNNKYKYELVGLKHQLVTSYGKDLYNYRMKVIIEEKEREIEYSYKSEIVNMTSTLLLDNAKGPIPPPVGGAGGAYGSGRSYYVNKNAFSVNKPMYMHYKGENFINNKKYNYYFYYESNGDNIYTADIKSTPLHQGQIIGSLLNNWGLIFKLNKEDKDEKFGYFLVIKDGNKVISVTPNQINLDEKPTLMNVELKTNRILYLKMDNYNYIATTNTPINIKVGGLGFDNNKKYSVLLFDNLYEDDWNYGSGNRVEMNEQIIEATGYELNNMLVTFKSKLTKIKTGYTQAIIIDIYEEGQVEFDETGYRVEHSMPIVHNEGDAILIKFLDSRDFFEKKANYIIDNTSDIIKNILKETDVSDFIDDIEIKENGKIKIYDNTGKNEMTGNVGTGMKAKVLDVNDFNLLDLDIVVKGDVSGDGNISITDLVKVKRHLAKEENLIGVYEIAGNITDTGKIGPTDLVKIARDVAKIEAIK